MSDKMLRILEAMLNGSPVTVRGDLYCEMCASNSVDSIDNITISRINANGTVDLYCEFEYGLTYDVEISQITI